MLRKRRTAHRFGDKRRTGDVLTEEKVDFSGLMLSSYVLEGLKSAGFERPSPIQLKAIPLGRCGLDLIAQAKSGTGKTCVFSVIALENINLSIMSIQVLVLAPTREIAVQIKDVMCSIGRHMEGLHVQVFIGGMPVEDNKKCLSQCHIAIGTPGRIKHLIENKFLKTDSIRLFILDEADKLLDDSFQSQTNWIYSTLPISKQMLALSATYTDHLAEHLRNYMKDPTFVRLNATDPSLEGIRHYRSVVPFDSLPHKVFQNKMDCLLLLLSKLPFHQCLIFSNYQIRARNLSETLGKNGWPSTYISGSQAQVERLKAMEKLKEFKCRILISTDLTSRGIDAERVNLVVNMDVPRDSETYLHRVGRAGRFGSYGAAINFVTDGKEMASLNDIEAGCGLVIAPLPEDISNLLTEPDSGGEVNRATAKPNVGKTRETTCGLPEQNPTDVKLDVQNERPQAEDGREKSRKEEEYKGEHIKRETEIFCRTKMDEGKESTIDDVGDMVGVEDVKENQGLEAGKGNGGTLITKDLEMSYAKNKGKVEIVDIEKRSMDHQVGDIVEGIGHGIKLVNKGDFVEHGVINHVSKGVDANATKDGEKEIKSTADINERVTFEEKPENDERPQKSTESGMFEGGSGNDGSQVEQEDMPSHTCGSSCVKLLTEQLIQTKSYDCTKASSTCEHLPTKLENVSEYISTKCITSKKKIQLIFRRNPTENCSLDIPKNGLLNDNSESLYFVQPSYDSFGYKESDSEDSDFEESGSCSSAFEESVSENFDCMKSTSEKNDSENQDKIDSTNPVPGESSSHTSSPKEYSSGNSDCQENGSKNSLCGEIVLNNSGFKEPDFENSSSGSSSLRESGSENSRSEMFSSNESSSELSDGQRTGDPEDIPVSKKEFDVVLDTFVEASMKNNPQMRKDPLPKTATNSPLGLQAVAQHDSPTHFENPSGFQETGRNSECSGFYGASTTDMLDYLPSLPCEWKHIWYKEYERQANLISNYAKFYCDTM